MLYWKACFWNCHTFPFRFGSFCPDSWAVGRSRPDFAGVASPKWLLPSHCALRRQRVNFPRLERAFKKERRQKNPSSVPFLWSSQSKICFLHSSRCQTVKFWITKCWTNVRKQCQPSSSFYFVCGFTPWIYVKPYLDHWCTLKTTFYSEILITVILKSSSEDRLPTYFVYTEEKLWILCGTIQFCNESQIFPDLPPYRQSGVKSTWVLLQVGAS